MRSWRISSGVAAQPIRVAQQERAKARSATSVIERGDRDVRGSIASSPWEEHAHASWTDSRWSRSDVDPPKRSGWREPPFPSSQPVRLPGVGSDARSARGVALGSTRDEGQRLEGIGWQRLVRGILLGHASSASSGHELG